MIVAKVLQTVAGFFSRMMGRPEARVDSDAAQVSLLLTTSFEDREVPDPLRICPDHGCLVQASDKYCPWHGTRVKSLIGFVVDQHKIDRALSSGAYGVVYRAVSECNPEFFSAIKILRPPYCYRPKSVEDFIGQTTKTKGFGGGNVVAIYDVRRMPWPQIRMELIRGPSLRQLIDQEINQETKVRAAEPVGPLFPVLNCLDILIGVARGLASAHRLRKLHRDIDPMNIMLRQEPGYTLQERVCVIDWGIALQLANEAELEEDQAQAEKEKAKKRKQIVGKLPYMAPESFRGVYSTRSDVYQLGVTAFELLTGERPYDDATEPTLKAWGRLHLSAPKSMSSVRAGIRKDVRKVVERCLAYRPEDRYANAGEVLEALEFVRWKILEPLWRKVAKVAAAVVPILLVAAFAFYGVCFTDLQDAGLLSKPWRPDVSPAVGNTFYIRSETAMAFVGPGNPVCAVPLGMNFQQAGKKITSAVFYNPLQAYQPVELKTLGEGADFGATFDVNNVFRVFGEWLKRPEAAPEEPLCLQLSIDLSGGPPWWIRDKIYLQADDKPPVFERAKIGEVDLLPQPGDGTKKLYLELEGDLQFEFKLSDNGALGTFDDPGDRSAAFLLYEKADRNNKVILRRPARENVAIDPSGRGEFLEGAYVARGQVLAYPSAYGPLEIEAKDKAGNVAKLSERGVEFLPDLWPTYVRWRKPEYRGNRVYLTFETRDEKGLLQEPKPEPGWFGVEIEVNGVVKKKCSAEEIQFKRRDESGVYELSLDLVKTVAQKISVSVDDRAVNGGGKKDAAAKADGVEYPFEVGPDVAPALEQDFVISSFCGQGPQAPERRSVFENARQDPKKAIALLRTRIRPQMVRISHQPKEYQVLIAAGAPWKVAAKPESGVCWQYELSAEEQKQDKGRLPFAFSTARDSGFVIDVQWEYDPSLPEKQEVTARVEGLEGSKPKLDRQVCSGNLQVGPGSPTLLLEGEWGLKLSKVEVKLLDGPPGKGYLKERGIGQESWQVKLSPEDVKKALYRPPGDFPQALQKDRDFEGLLRFAVTYTDVYGNTETRKHILVLAPSLAAGPGILLTDEVGNPAKEEPCVSRPHPCRLYIWSRHGIQSVKVKEATEDRPERPLFWNCAGTEPPRVSEPLDFTKHTDRIDYSTGVRIEVTVTDLAGRSSTVRARIINPNPPQEPDFVPWQNLRWLLIPRDKPTYMLQTEVSAEQLDKLLPEGSWEAILKKQEIHDLTECAYPPDEIIQKAQGARAKPIEGVCWEHAQALAEQARIRLPSYEEIDAILVQAEGGLVGGPDQILRNLLGLENFANSPQTPELLEARGQGQVVADVDYPRGNEGNPAFRSLKQFGLEQFGLKQFLGNCSELVLEASNPGVAAGGRARRYLFGCSYVYQFVLNRNPQATPCGFVMLRDKPRLGRPEEVDDDWTPVKKKARLKRTGFRFVVDADMAVNKGFYTEYVNAKRSVNAKPR
ncbi:MAG: serine/threonine protein kinase [Planctomycetes bacterium]|nr:serine/threonine protein kinase [Planctomycetota bacterium]